MIFRFLFWYPLRVSAPFLPERALSLLAALCARLLYLTDRRRADILREAFSAVPDARLSGKKLNGRVRRSLYIFCMARIDLFRFKKGRSEIGGGSIILEGKDRLDAAIQLFTR